MQHPADAQLHLECSYFMIMLELGFGDGAATVHVAMDARGAIERRALELVDSLLAPAIHRSLHSHNTFSWYLRFFLRMR